MQTNVTRSEVSSAIQNFVNDPNFEKRLARGGVTKEQFRKAAEEMLASQDEEWFEDILSESDRIYPSLRHAQFIHAVFTWIKKGGSFDPNEINWA